MTDTEKLNMLIEYIQSAEKYAFEKHCYESEEAKFERVCAIQDLTTFIEYSLGIELEQLPMDEEKVTQKIPDKNIEGIRELAREIGDVPSAYLEGLNDAILVCMKSDIDYIIKNRNLVKSWR